MAVQKNHLGGLILYRSLDPSKKRRQGRKIDGSIKIDAKIVKDIKFRINNLGK